MLLSFDTKNQIITRTDANRAIANSTDYFEVSVTFSANWNGYDKTICFKNGDTEINIMLVNNAVPKEAHLNLGVGTWKVSIIGIKGNHKILTNAVNLPVGASGYIGTTGPTPRVYEELLTIIQSLHTEVASEAALRSAVEQFVDENFHDIVISDVYSKSEIDSMIVTKTVNDLVYYWNKSQTYNRAEIEALIEAAIQGTYIVVQTLPTTDISTHAIYLVPKESATVGDYYNEYINTTGTSAGWEHIGTTEIDLSNYYTKAEINALLDNKVDKVSGKGLSTNDYDNTAKNIVDGVTSALANKVDKETGKGLSTNDYDNTAKGIVDGVTAALAGKVDKETGKGLSTNDYDNTEKAKLAGIAENATKTEGSLVNGNIKINGTEKTVYDDTELDSRVDTVEQDLSTDTATVEGNPLNFTTLSAQKAVETVISLEPIQAGEGDPSPTNIRPIDGRTETSLVRSRYTPISSLRLSDGKRINTNIDGSLPNLIVETEAMFENFYKYGTLFRNYKNEDANATRAIQGDGAGYLLMNTNTIASRPISFLNVAIGEFHYIKLNNNTRECYVDNERKVVPIYSGTVNNNPIILGNMISTPTIQFKYFKAYNGETLIFNGIPCVNPEGVEGLYDTVSQSFFYDDSGVPIYDPDFEITLQFGEKVYGAKVELEKGTVTVDRAYALLNDPDKWVADTGTINFRYEQMYTDRKLFADSFTGLICSYLPVKSTASQYARWRGAEDYRFGLYVSSVDLNQVKADASAGKIAICYELATPRTIQLTPNEISLLLGVNVISTDADGITLTYRDGKVATLGDLDSLNVAFNDALQDTAADLSDDITTAQNTANTALAYAQNKVYGMRIRESVESNPASIISYLADAVGMTPVHMDYTNNVFDYGSWEDVWFIKDCKPCILGQDGAVQAYLNKNDYTKDIYGNTVTIDENLTGANVMIEFPKIWYKIVPVVPTCCDADVFISPVKLDDDYKDFAYIAQDKTRKEHFYMPAYNGSIINDGTNDVMRSLSGQAVGNSKRGTVEIQMAQRNGTGWYTETFSQVTLINLLLMLIGKSTDTQTVFGRGIDTGSQTAFNEYRTGAGNTKGMFWGSNDGTQLSKVFGIENWWSLQWRRFAGLMYVNGTFKYKMCWGQEDGSTTDNYNTDASGYIESPSPAPSGTSGGYISRMFFTSVNMLMSVVSGSSSTKYCDGVWFNNSATTYALRGGSSGDGALCGAFALHVRNAVSSAYWYLGAALSYT